MGAFVGIDLGTTFSVVAAIGSDGHAQALPNTLGQLLTPSVVDLAAEPPLVGWEAKEKQQFGDEGVYAYFKRDMGNPNALYLHHGQPYTPVDLSALVLRYLKASAEAALGENVTDAVITVPAYFNNMQREATIEAGRRAGLNVLRIINEPTAAALAYGIRPSKTQSTILVYDLGGGTFDVSLVALAPDELRVVATAGDHYLGGKDWDDRILQYVSTQFEAEFGLELLGDDLNALLVQAENAKISLSVRPAVQVIVQAGGQTGHYTITREQFETMTGDLMERTQRLVEQVLGDAGTSWQNIQGVILVGGSTRMPMVQTYVERMAGQPPLRGVHPDQAVALGAAMQAALDMEQHGAKVLLLGGRRTSVDVISNSLGMIAENEDRTRYINSIIIQKNQPIPCQQTRPYQLRVGRQREQHRLEVFMTQGESDAPQDCTYLGKYVFSGIPNVGIKTVVIDITYAYNINGVVKVSAVERNTKQPLKLSIEPLPADVPERFLQPPAKQARQDHVTVYMAIDVSGSMAGKPLQEAKLAAVRFVNEIDLTAASIGIIQWSDHAQIVTRACQNAREISQGIESLHVGRTGYGTGGNPFQTILELLGQAGGTRYGLVLTDGELDHQKRAIASAEACRAVGIEIIAIGFGRADKKFLQAVSSSDEHSFFVDMGELTATFSTIAQVLTEGGGQLDRERLSERRQGLRLL
jgi:molecular chaperone DnaK